LNGTYQFLVYAEDVHTIRENMNTTKQNKEVLLDAGRAVGLEVNTEKTTPKCKTESQFTDF